MSPAGPIRYLSRADVESLRLTARDLAAPLRDALREKSGDPRAETPPKMGLHPRPHAALHAAAGYLPSRDISGLKWIARFPDNPRRHALPTCLGLCVLNDSGTGRPLAVMDASWITEVRTAVASAVALDAARPDGVRAVAVLGFGAQGASHLTALPQVVAGIEVVRVYSAHPARARERVAALAPRVRVEVADRPEEALDGVDAVVSAIPMAQPPSRAYSASLLPDGCVVVAIDFDAAWDLDIFDRVRLFAVDDVEQYREFKEQQGFFAGYPDDPRELADLLGGAVEAPRDGLVYLNNLGIGVEDVVTARVVLDAAERRGVGRLLEP